MPIEFTNRDFQEGFWYYRPAEAFPPPGLSEVSRYSGEERLSIVGAPRVSPRKQERLTGEWVKALPSLDAVRILWVSHRVSQIMFDAICGMQGLEALWIKAGGMRSIRGITRLGRLESLHIGSSPSLESIAPLAGLRGLKWLELENIRRIRDISTVGECTGLLGLGIEGGMWSAQRVESLAPVARLEKLRYLRITNLRSADRTLKPLFGLGNLERFFAARWWNPAEIDELQRRNPGLQPRPGRPGRG